MKKILALVIALLMIVPAVVACGGGGNPDGTTVAGGTTATPSGTTANPSGTTATPGGENNPDGTTSGNNQTTTGGGLVEDTPTDMIELPEDKLDMTVRVLTRGGDWVAWDIVYDDSEEPLVVDTLNDAINVRNEALYTKYGVDIEQITAPGSVQSEAELKIMTNKNEYDLILPTITEAGQLAQKGYLIPTDELEYMDTKQPWYDQRCFEELAIGGKNYFFFSDITAVNLDAIWTFFFNHNLIDLYDLENPYDLVANYTWTFDKMLEMCEAATPTRAEGTPTKDDGWGIVGHDYIITAVYIGSGERVATADANGKISLTMNNDALRVTNIMEKLIELKPYWCRYALTSNRYADDYGTPERYGFGPEDNYQELIGVFSSENALFLGEVLSTLREDKFVDTDIEVGVLPTPMFGDEQDEYYCAVNGVAPAMAVPITSVDLRSLSIVIEAWARESHETLLPAYYDNCMTTRYAKDNITSDILDMIFESRTYDLGIYYGWGELAGRFTALTYAGKTDFASMYRRQSMKAANELQAFVENFGSN